MTERILLVDDEPNVVLGLRRQLGRRYDIHVAMGGAEALEVLEAQGPIAVVVSDMRMPQMDGLRLLSQVAERSPDTVRVMLTGNADQMTAVKAINEGGVFRFISKPATSEAVAAIIDAALHQYRLHRAARMLAEQAEATRAALERERELNGMQRQFVAMVSHEFRTPLAIIDSAMELLGGGYALTPEQTAKRVTQVRSAVRRMTDLIEMTLTTARLDAGKLEFAPAPLDLRAVLGDVVDRAASAHPKHRFRLSGEGAAIAMRGDRKLLDHLLSNLVGNAAKYSPGADLVEIDVTLGGDAVAVAVLDRGLGIPADEYPRLFQRFFRASSSTGIPGTGIGLNLAQHFAALHGGDIRAEPRPGGGSVFTVRLPLAGGPARSDNPRTEAA